MQLEVREHTDIARLSLSCVKLNDHVILAHLCVCRKDGVSLYGLPVIHFGRLRTNDPGKLEMGHRRSVLQHFRLASPHPASNTVMLQSSAQSFLSLFSLCVHVHVCFFNRAYFAASCAAEQHDHSTRSTLSEFSLENLSISCGTRRLTQTCFMHTVMHHCSAKALVMHSSLGLAHFLEILR